MVSLAGAKAAASSLVHWDSPVASGSTLAFVLAILVSICYYSLISVAAYISLTLLVLVLGIKIYSYAMVFMKKVSHIFQEVPGVRDSSWLIVLDSWRQFGEKGLVCPRGLD